MTTEKGKGPSDYESQLQGDSGEAPEAWVPQKSGEYIIGKVKRYERGTTGFGARPICIIETKDGERSIWLLHHVLLSQFDRTQPQPGDVIGVKLLDAVHGKSGFTYQNYVVRVYERAGDDPRTQVPEFASYIKGNEAASDELPF